MKAATKKSATKATSPATEVLRAFRRGAKAVWPTRGLYYSVDNGRRKGCAVGALAFGVGQVNGNGGVDQEDLRRRYPILTTEVKPCPAGRCLAGTATLVPPDILRTMEHLFEYHEWSFDQIAAWLAKFSAKASTAIALQGEIVTGRRRR